MNKKQKKNLKKIIVSVMLVILIFVSEHFIRYDSISIGRIPAGRFVLFFLYMVPYLTVGKDILKKAFRGIINKQVMDENFLMAAATIGAIVVALLGKGDYTEAVMVMLFYQIGELFQSIAVGKSRKNIAALMDIRPDTANLVTDDGIQIVSPDDVSTGSIIVVRPGEKIPIDGIVTEGLASLNTSSLTGESIPRKTETGDEVMSGCISIDGLIRIRTTRSFGESTVSKVLGLIENASSNKSRSENFISRFARIYTPAVCIGALVIMIIPPIIRSLFSVDPMLADWVYRGLTFLVISCPCALVISIPLTFFAGIGGASRSGILVKGSNYLEALSKVKHVVFDKTGTMTKGSFRVTDIVLAPDHTLIKEELLRLAACAESYSLHPISVSIRNAFEGVIDENAVKDIEEAAGEGVTAIVSVPGAKTKDGDGVAEMISMPDLKENEGNSVIKNASVLSQRKVAVGSLKLMKRFGLEPVEPDCSGSKAYVAVDGRYEGCLIISDEIKENSAKAVDELKKLKMDSIVMLTGDNERSANETANILGIENVYSSLLPQDKVSMVEGFLASEKKEDKLAFVGDGINDAPVLTRADVGIAMGALGSDAAIEAADVVLMDDDPLKIPGAVKIAKRCMKIVKENTYFAIAVKAACLVLAAMGIANMWLAVFADVGVMVIAVFNAMRALINK